MVSAAGNDPGKPAAQLTEKRGVDAVGHRRLLVAHRQPGALEQLARAAPEADLDPATTGTKPESAMIPAGRGRPAPRPSAYDITAPCEKPAITTLPAGTSCAAAVESSHSPRAA
jgi:hypothetical protein